MFAADPDQKAGGFDQAELRIVRFNAYEKAIIKNLSNLSEVKSG